jgi:hypothetical protein
MMALSGCETVQITARHPCALNQTFALGATCADTISSVTNQITEADAIAMLQAQQAVTNPDGSTTPAHAPAIFQSADDYGTETIEMDTACRLLGNNCSYELEQTVRTRKDFLVQIRKGIIP